MPGRSITSAKRREDLRVEPTLVGEQDAKNLLANNLRDVVPLDRSLDHRFRQGGQDSIFFRSDDRTGIMVYVSKSEFGFLAPIFEREREVHKAASKVLARFEYNREDQGAVLSTEYIGESAQSSDEMEKAKEKVLAEILSAFKVKVPRDLTVKPAITIRIFEE